MDGMNPFSSDQWIQQYLKTDLTRSGGEPSDDATISVYRNSNQGTSSQVGPKPIRRRSRASRRTPTVVLNASPTDFRALVQRFTGCDSNDNMASASVSAVSLPKGPVNIDFARNDVNETSSSRYAYFDNQVRSHLQVEQMQSVDGLNDLQAGYGILEKASVVYQPNDESLLMATRKDGGRHGYN